MILPLITFILGLILGLKLRGFSKSVDKGSNFDESWKDEEINIK